MVLFRRLILCHTPWRLSYCRALHASPTSFKSGHYKITPKADRPLTYEQTQPPHLIGVTKGWNSLNTTTLHNVGRQPADTAVEDWFIRRFIQGTWPKIWLSEVIIRRQHNNITIAGLVCPVPSFTAMHFLVGYAEELLSHLLRCNVKVELQCVKSKHDVIYKYI